MPCYGPMIKRWVDDGSILQRATLTGHGPDVGGKGMQHDLYGLEVHLRHTRFEMERTIAAYRQADLVPASPGPLARLRISIGQVLVLAGTWLAGSPAVPGPVPISSGAAPSCPVIRSVSGRSVDPTALHRPAA
jgi:hypothetical protein